MSARHDTYNACRVDEVAKAAFVIDYAREGFISIETATHLVPYTEVAAKLAKANRSFGFWHIRLKATGQEGGAL